LNFNFSLKAQPDGVMTDWKVFATRNKSPLAGLSKLRLPKSFKRNNQL